jgi:hypothetical protein
MQSSRCQHDTSTHAKFCLECGTPVAGGSGGHSVMFDLSSALKGAVRDEWTAGGTPILVDPLAVERKRAPAGGVMLKNFDAVKGPSGVEIASQGA